MKRTVKGSLLLLSAMLGACATQPAPPESDEREAVAEPALPIRTSPEMFSDLLVAEVAAQRNALGVTLAYYSQVAKASNDPEVIHQAAQLAHYMEEHQLAHELAGLWLKQSPGDARAHEIAALSAISLGEPEEAARHIDVLMQRAPAQALAELVSRARGLDEEGNNLLLAALSSLVDRFPEQPPLWYARALHLQNAGETERALEACQRALSENPDHVEARLLRIRLLHKLGRSEQALRHARDTREDLPDQPRAHVHYIRLLISTDRHEKAASALEKMADRFPEAPQLRFSLALFALENDAPKLARSAMTALLQEGYRVDDMHLYLGQAAELAGDPEAAIQHFLDVSGGEQRVRARLQAARLMYEQGRDGEAAELMSNLRDHNPGRTPSLYAAQAEMLSRADQNRQALELLNNALAGLPDNTELLYARALIAERMGKLGQVEADLRRVLELKPDDPVALNALGYTLADHNLRLDEARSLIEQALKKQPENPAFIDSMGWLLYREGKLEEAREWLQRARNKLNDPEVSAHLGEVLWELGEKEKARAVWREAHDAHPDNRPLNETMDRYLETSS